MSVILSRAIEIASYAHRAQVDRGGKAYILHPLRVMMALNTDDEELMAIAILHDTFEDHIDDLKVQTYLHSPQVTERMYAALVLLTHDKGTEYGLYINNICRNYDAIRVKMADLEDNSRLTRLKGLTEKDFERMQKYQKAYTVLKAARAGFEKRPA